MTEFVGVAVVCAVCGYILDTLGFRGTRVYLAFVSALLLIVTLGAASPLISELMSFSRGELTADIGASALRVLGIGYIGGFFSEFCTQLGAKGAADGLTLFARVQMLGVVMPHFLDILRSAGELF